MNKTIIRAILPTMSVDDLVSVILDTADPFAQKLPYIMDNGHYRNDSLTSIKKEKGADFILDAMDNGRYRKDDLYFFYSEDGCEIYSFSSTTDAIAYTGLEELAEYISHQLEDDAEKTAYETTRKILRDYARIFPGELNEALRTDPVTIQGFEF